MKKAVIVLSLLSLVTGACSFPFPGKESSEKPAADITVHVGLNWIPPAKNDGMFDRLRAKASGIHAKWTYETGDNEDTGRRLKLTSGDLPDIWAFTGPNGQAQTDFLNAKVLLPIEKYLNMPEKYPNLSKLPAKVKEYIRAPDGHTYFIPLFTPIEGTETSGLVRVSDGFWSWGQNGIFVRSDILKAVGMQQEELGTLEGFEIFLEKASVFKDEQGNPLIPLTMGDNFKGWRSIGSLFGVDSVNEASGMSPGEDGEFVAARDHPGYKLAWEWLNRMYGRGLLDPEVLTHKNELYLKKLNSGRAAAYLGSMSDLAESGWSKAKSLEDVSTRFLSIPFPKVQGVKAVGAIETSGAMPWTGAYIMKGKNVEASLQFLDWTLGHDIMTVKYGPPGESPAHVWNWNDSGKTTWSFHEKYAEDLTSGDTERNRKYGQQPWFLANTNVPDEDTSLTKREAIKYKLQKQNGMLLATTGVKREAHNYDTVPVMQSGIIESYSSVLDDIESNYRARLLVAKGRDEFAKVWAEYRNELESKGRWSEYKLEWQAQYYEFSKKVVF